MARVKNTLIGRASGSVGETTFLTYKKINVLRAKMSHQTNPNSIPQQTKRNSYNGLYGLFLLLKPLLIFGLRDSFRKMDLKNFFFKLNYKSNISSPVPPTVIIDYENIRVSMGLEEIYSNPFSYYQSSPRRIRIFFTTPIGSPTNPDDLIYVVFVNLTQNIAVYSLGEKTRSDGIVLINLATTWLETDVILCYYFFINHETKKKTKSKMVFPLYVS